MSNHIKKEKDFDFDLLRYDFWVLYIPLQSNTDACLLNSMSEFIMSVLCYKPKLR